MLSGHHKLLAWSLFLPGPIWGENMSEYQWIHHSPALTSSILSQMQSHSGPQLSSGCKNWFLGFLSLALSWGLQGMWWWRWNMFSWWPCMLELSRIWRWHLMTTGQLHSIMLRCVAQHYSMLDLSHHTSRVHKQQRENWGKIYSDLWVIIIMQSCQMVTIKVTIRAYYQRSSEESAGFKYDCSSLGFSSPCQQCNVLLLL